MSSHISAKLQFEQGNLTAFDVLCWRLLIWVLGLSTPLMAALKPRIFTVGGVDIVESGEGFSHLVVQGLYIFFLLIMFFIFLHTLSIKKKAGQWKARFFWLLTILLAAMPTISSLVSGEKLQWTIVGVIGLYSATYFLPHPNLDWWIREVRIMLLVVFIYGSIVAAILFPNWAWDKDYATESAVAIFSMRLFGTANHANALAPLAAFTWLLGRLPNCRLPWEYIHGIAILMVLFFAQSKTIWIISIFLIGIYLFLKVRTMCGSKKYFIYATTTLSFTVGFIYLIKYSSYASRIQDLMYDPQIFTLTGRLPLWLLAINMWLDKPWIGQGLEAWSSGALLDNIRLLGWAAPHAHNQILQILSQAGLIGLAVMILWVFRMWNILNTAPIKIRTPLRWLFIFFFLPSFTEVILQYAIGPGSTILTWIMFVIVLIIAKNYSTYTYVNANE